MRKKFAFVRVAKLDIIFGYLFLSRLVGELGRIYGEVMYGAKISGARMTSISTPNVISLLFTFISGLFESIPSHRKSPSAPIIVKSLSH